MAYAGPIQYEERNEDRRGVLGSVHPGPAGERGNENSADFVLAGAGDLEHGLADVRHDRTERQPGAAECGEVSLYVEVLEAGVREVGVCECDCVAIPKPEARAPVPGNLHPTPVGKDCSGSPTRLNCSTSAGARTPRPAPSSVLT